MAVDPLAQLTVTAHPLGNELRVRWILPDTLPDNFKVIVFSRSDQFPSDAEIANYCNNNQTAAGLTVFDDLAASTLSLFDRDLVNNKTYYYGAIIQDTDTKEFSSKLTKSGSPVFLATTHVIDSKTLVVEAVKKILQNYSAINHKDYTIRKSYSLEKVTPPLIAVVRQGANEVQRMWGNILKDDESEQQYGQYEQDNLLIIWEDVSSDRRDILTNIMRANEKIISNHLVENGAIEVKTSIQGDDLDMRWENMQMHMCSIAVQITFESFVQHADQELKIPVGDVNHA